MAYNVSANPDYHQGDLTCYVHNHDGLIYDLRNASDDYVVSQFFYTKPERYFILSFFPMILTFGLIGNFAFLVVVARVSGMRTIANAYLINLAFCDIIFIFLKLNDVLISFVMSPDARSKRFDSSFDCTLAHELLYGIHFTADCLIIFMSFERYLAICKPLKHKIMSTEGRTLKCIIFSWIVGHAYASIVVPRFAILDKICVIWPDHEQYKSLPMYLKDCTAIHPDFHWISPFVMSVPYTLAFFLNSLMYYKIIKKMHSRIVKVGDVSQQNSAYLQPVAEGNNVAHVARNKVARLLITTGLTYFLCFLPYIVMQLNYAVLYASNWRVGINMSESTFWTAYWICVGLATLNSAVNPLIYSVTNSRYRNAFKQVFSCKVS